MPEFDVLVIGGGASGLRAAIAAKEAGASVGLISKAHPLRTHTGLIQGGLNAPLDPDDSPESFAADTMQAGDGLCDSEAVKTFAGEAARDVLWLERAGTPFNRDAQGKLAFRAFGSNSRNRSVFADDRTGHMALQVLYEQLQRARVTAFEEWYVTSLVIEDGACTGALALGLRSGSLEAFSARAVILATGGLGRLYAPSTGSVGTTGDGQSLAYQAGAGLVDMEFVQFHPMIFPAGPGLLITEATLGEGAQLVDAKGAAVDTRGLPRHQLALATQSSNGDSAKIDLRPIGAANIMTRFPQTHELVKAMSGLDVTQEAIPVRPAAHRPMGGIETNASGETSIRGLFAAGECASNGVHGASRMAGNTLTEALVFGRRAGEAAASHARLESRKSVSQSRLGDEENRIQGITGENTSGDTPGKLHAELTALMDQQVGLVRDAAGLDAAIGKIRGLKDRYSRIKIGATTRVFNYGLTGYFEVGAMLTCAELIAVSARQRTETRGAHRRSDFPAKDDANWSAHTTARLVDGSPAVEKKPITAA
ncbi:MAG: FAD-binding protein [Chloroflexi bacterium]|nr:FAD-binding protein [Chloroflexota bacterium]